jgi:hypothetical protein
MNPSMFHQYCVADTCAIWNLLASQIFYDASRRAGCALCCTSYVLYEALYKPRTAPPTIPEITLQSRLRCEIESGTIRQYGISIDDLQQVDVLAMRKRVSKGEISSIVFAKKTRQAFLSEDDGAVKLARTELELAMVQTSTLLFAWLLYHSWLDPSQCETVVSDLEACGRGLRQRYESACQVVINCRSAS